MRDAGSRGLHLRGIKGVHDTQLELGRVRGPRFTVFPMLDIRRARENSDGGKGARPEMADEEMPGMALQNEPFRRPIYVRGCRVRMGIEHFVTLYV